MKFIISQRTTDYYVIEADSEEEAYEIVTSGDIEVSNTKYEDFNTENVEA